jgi:hypothetical protein
MVAASSFELADIARAAATRTKGNPADLSPLALEAVRRIDAIFVVERVDLNLRP